MRRIIRHLLFPTSRRFSQCRIHRICHNIGIQNHTPICITRRTTNCLNQRTRRPQESFFVRVHNCNQFAFWHVQPFAQQIDTNQDIIFAQTQITQQFYTFQRFNITVQVFCPNAVFIQIISQLLCHLFGQCCNQHASRRFLDLCQ